MDERFSTNRLHLAVRVYSDNNARVTSKRGKNKEISSEL